jgi:gamma-glutamyltranspeptidase/glutathione hydrolase
VLEGGKVWIEPGFKQDVVDELKRRGHNIEIRKPAEFGGAQLILKLEDGYLVASDHRKDGCAGGF